MKNNKFLTILIITSIVILVGIVLYKLVIEPVQLKKEYLSCVEKAETADYSRWQDIEKQITEKDKLVKELGIEADEKKDDFYTHYKTKQEFVDFMNDCMNSGGAEGLWGKLNESSCKGAMRQKIEAEVRREEKILRDLYKKRDSNGEILEKELKECEKHFKMFSKSY